MKKIHLNTSLVVLAIFLVVFFTGCANIFCARYEKIAFQPATQGATVTPPKEGISRKHGHVCYDKMRVYHVVKVEKSGYKTTNYAFGLTKRSPAFATAVLDLLVPIYGWFMGLPLDLRSPKTRLFDKVQKIPGLTPYNIRKKDEKFIVVNNTAFDAKGSDIIWHQYLGLKDYKNGKHNDMRSVRKANKSGEREDIKVENSIFTDALNSTLRKMNFIDTANTVFPAISNTIFLNATVKKITIADVQSRLIRHATRSSITQIPNDLLSVELEIEWEVLDYYKQKIYTTTTTLKSDLFMNNWKENKQLDKFFDDAVGDNLEYALLKIRKELSEKDLLKMSGPGSENTVASLTLTRPVISPGSRMNDFMKSAVTIKVDDGHGSGAVISEDGYIITSYHVVVNSKKIEVVFSDGTTAEGTVFRKNEDADLAIVKVSKSGLSPLPISLSKDPEIGIDVWAIGTPKSIELGQSVSKGVLSGLRKSNDVSYIQTDVSINGGNSGGPLIDKQGNILGIVTAKLVGIGTEGLGFAISSDEVMKRLKIEYK